MPVPGESEIGVCHDPSHHHQPGVGLPDLDLEAMKGRPRVRMPSLLIHHGGYPGTRTVATSGRASTSTSAPSAMVRYVSAFATRTGTVAP